MNDVVNKDKLFYIRTINPSLDVSFDDDNPEETNLIEECEINICEETNLVENNDDKYIEVNIDSISECIVLFNNEHYFNDG
jgi:hypothetical protein